MLAGNGKEEGECPEVCAGTVSGCGGEGRAEGSSWAGHVGIQSGLGEFHALSSECFTRHAC